MSWAAFAQRPDFDRIELNLNQIVRGQETIALKRELRYQYPRLNVNALQLRAVMLVAKSGRGMADALLRVGMQRSYPKMISGNPRDFNLEAPHTYERIKLKNPSYDSAGKWQIETRGRIKLKKVILIVKNTLKKRNIRLVVKRDIKGFGTIPLKRMIKQKNPNLNLDRMELDSVQLLAKSARGFARATLLVGSSVGRASTIEGNPRAFQSHHPSSFRITELRAPQQSRINGGRWQVEIDGRVRVKEIMVTLRPVRYRGNNGRSRRSGGWN